MDKPTPEIAIMVDVETLATTPDAVVTQLGAVVWSLVDERIIDDLHTYLPIQPQLDQGRIVNAKTLGWWFEQSKEAQAAFTKSMDDDPVTLGALLRHFAKFIQDNTPRNGAVEIWARGPQFDLVLVESLLRSNGLPSPWAYDAGRDLRTLMRLAGVNSADVERDARLVAHNAHHDCLFQIKCYQEAMRSLRAR